MSRFSAHTLTCPSLFAKALVIAGLFTIGVATSALAQNLPAGGEHLIQPSELTPGKISTRFGGDEFGQSEIVDSQHSAFKQHLRIDIKQQPANTWDIGASRQITSAVKKDDLLLVGFWAKGKSADGNGGGVVEFVFERNGDPYTKSVQYLVETKLGADWTKYWVRFRSLEDYAPGEAVINFQLGYLASTLDLGGIEAWNFSDRVTADQLPNSELTYLGRETDAPWRAEAAERIEKHRKANMQLTVVDPNGQPVAGAPVHVELKRHAFDFGSAVSVDMLTGNGDSHDRYRAEFQKNFNLAVIENGLKWKIWDGNPPKQQTTIKALDWLHERSIPTRGHVMVWPGHRYLPTWIKSIEQNPEALRKVIDGHIREVGYATQDKLRDWDVLNEVFDNRDLTNALGDEEMPRWFHVAKSVAPNAKLYYNDYAGLVRGGFPTGHKAHFEETVRYLIDNGAPIDGIGLQGHFGSILTSPRRLVAELDRWGKFDLDMLITEFDVTVAGDQLRADFTRDFLTACFSHPKVDGILVWGFWAGAHWKPDAALFDQDWNPTLPGKQWIELTQKTWSTNETLTTDAKGQVQLRGFKGDYSVTVGAQTSEFKHADNDTNVAVAIE